MTLCSARQVRWLVALTATAALVTACSTPEVPTLSTFSAPTPSVPTSVLSPAQCVARGGDDAAVAACMSPYLSIAYGQVLEPVVTRRGLAWEPPTLVFAEEPRQTACGTLREPSYCPDDGTIVLPASQVAKATRKGAELIKVNRDEWTHDLILSQFAPLSDSELDDSTAYGLVLALAHEYGHHVQSLMGTIPRRDELARMTTLERAAVSSRVELVADCLAGWAIRAEGLGSVTPTQEFGVLSALVGIGDDFGAAVDGGRRPDVRANTHGSIGERTGAYFASGSFTRPQQDPWTGCQDSVRRLLAARATAS